MTLAVQRVPIAKIKLDPATQTRAATRHDIVDEYAEDAALLPACVLFTEDEKTYHIGDGFHRIPAWAKAGFKEVPADVRRGTQRDAMLHACGANDSHGLRRTTQDKERCVRLLLEDEEWGKASDRWIAEQCKVSHPFVAKVRGDANNGHSGGQSVSTGNISSSPNGAVSSPTGNRIGKDGRTRGPKKAPLCDKCSRLPSPVKDCPQCASAREAAKKKAKKAKRKAPPAEVKDRNGRVVPDGCRDAFADPQLGELIDGLESLEAMLKPDPLVEKAGKLCDHYPFLLIDKVKQHAWEALHQIQLAISALKAGVPYAVCPKCDGVAKEGKVCRTCRGSGHVPHHRWEELKAEK